MDFGSLFKAGTRRFGGSSTPPPLSYMPPEERNPLDQQPRPKKWLPRLMRPVSIGALVAGMILLAVGIQIALMMSERTQGWRVPGLTSFGGNNFLKSFLPVILVMPIAYVWGKVDQALVNMHPYVVISQGNATAEGTLLVDYSGNLFGIIFRSLRYGHWLVFFSSWICVGTMFLSPLASGLLTVKSTEVVIKNFSIQNMKTLGLAPDYRSLESFVAAAGYATAAAVHNLTDPPFVQSGWAVAEFVVPDEASAGINGTVVVPTTAVQTKTDCSRAEDFSLTPQTGNGTSDGFAVTGTWQGCLVGFVIDTSSTDQFGVAPVGSCSGANATIPDPYKPVVFWVYSAQARGANLTFCHPSVQLLNVEATIELSDERVLKDVRAIGGDVKPNNVSGSPQNGRAFNGIAFDLTGASRLVQARSLAIQTGVPAAIYRAASDLPGGVVGVMATPNGFVEITDRVYLQFLSIIAKSTYFVDSDDIIKSDYRTSEPRLRVYPVAANTFTAALVLVAIMGALVHISHARARRNVWLSCDPSTMASTVSMTSHSEFRKLLYAGDSDEDMAQKLKNLRFGISKRSWQVIAEGEEEGLFRGSRGVGGYVGRGEDDEAQRSLLAPDGSSKERIQGGYPPTPAGVVV